MLVSLRYFKLTFCRVLFYPPLGYAFFVWKLERNQENLGSAGDDGAEERERTERTPLLSQENQGA